MMGTDLTFGEAIAAMATADVARTVVARYREPWRAYHDELHLAELKGHLLQAERDGMRIHDGVAALGFVLWHDSIYDPQAGKGRNEALSAQLCAFELGTIAHPASVQRACEAILATIGHQAPDAAISPDAALLLDCDLAILGSAPERFDLYDVAIREEYAHVPDEVYHPARRAVLQGFLDRRPIYATEWARGRWERRARENLARTDMIG